MVQVLIVEDDPIIAKDLAYTLADLGYEVTSVCRTVQQALSALDTRLPDVMICDIHLEGDEWDGIRLVQEVRKTYELPILFLTAFSDGETIRRAAQVSPEAYLVKPFDERTLYAAIELAISKFSNVIPPAQSFTKVTDDAPRFVAGSLFIKEKKRLIKVRVEDIYWLKADGAYTLVHTPQQQYFLSTNLGIMEEKLKAYSFVRTHRSYLINLQRIEYIEDDVVTIASERIPLGKSYRDDFYRQLDLL
jgi:DNA-binding LytR/AlgR family response regulator